MAKSFEGSETFQSSPDKILSLINNFEAQVDFCLVDNWVGMDQWELYKIF